MFEYMKEIIGITPKFKRGDIYQMIKDKKILDVGLKEIILY